jgi:SDR family mycofactocin-dependent oxidoreductase
MDMGLLDGRTAFITGAARGQGRAHALRLASEGARIIGVDVCKDVESVDYQLATSDDLTDTQRLVEEAGGEILVQQADVRDQGSLDSAFAAGLERFGSIDIAVANAGIVSMAPLHEMTEERWAEMLDINLSGVWRTIKAVAPTMIQQRSGSIVLIGSINSLEATVELGHYTAAKHGVVGVCRTTALELSPFGIRCNVISPGSVDTGMINWQGMYDRFAGQPGGGPHDMHKGGARYSALAPTDVLDPDEISKAVLYLGSDLSSSVTGIVLPVDRGHLLLPKQNTNPATYAEGLA